MTLTRSFSIGQITASVLHDRPDEQVPFAGLSDTASAEDMQAEAARFGLTNEATLSYNNMLVQSDGQNILLDPGWGTGFDEYQGRTAQALEELGLTADDIHVVFLSHSHLDHYADMITESGDKHYPNARYTMLRREFEFYSSDEYKSGIEDERRELMQVHYWPMEKHLDLLDGDEVTIAPGVTVIHAPGHTKHHAAVEISSEGQTLLALIDSFPNPMHFNNTDWYWGFEIDKPQLTETRKMLIERALQKDALVTLYHTAFPGAGRLSRDGDRIGWTPED